MAATRASLLRAVRRWRHGGPSARPAGPSTVGTGAAATRILRVSRDAGLARGRIRVIAAARRAAVRSEVAAGVLLALDGLEERLEVALAEAERAVALDQLEEDRRAVAERLGEDLQQVAVLVAVDQDPALLQLLDRARTLPMRARSSGSS